MIELLSFHMLPEKVTLAEAGGLETGEVKQGKRLSICRGRLRVNGVRVVVQDVLCRNGVVHVVNELLLPPRRHLASVLGYGHGAPSRQNPSPDPR